MEIRAEKLEIAYGDYLAVRDMDVRVEKGKITTIIGPNGVKGKVPVELTYDEQAKLRASADALKEVIASLDI